METWCRIQNRFIRLQRETISKPLKSTWAITESLQYTDNRHCRPTPSSTRRFRQCRSSVLTDSRQSLRGYQINERIFYASGTHILWHAAAVSLCFRVFRLSVCSVGAYVGLLGSGRKHFPTDLPPTFCSFLPVSCATFRHNVVCKHKITPNCKRKRLHSQPIIEVHAVLKLFFKYFNQVSVRIKLKLQRRPSMSAVKKS